MPSYASFIVAILLAVLAIALARCSFTLGVKKHRYTESYLALIGFVASAFFSLLIGLGTD